MTASTSPLFSGYPHSPISFIEIPTFYTVSSLSSATPLQYRLDTALGGLCARRTRPNRPSETLVAEIYEEKEVAVF
jgi:hypothetical protein